MAPRARQDRSLTATELDKAVASLRNVGGLYEIIALHVEAQNRRHVRYIGGKSKLAGRIAETILATTAERDTYIEPFVGGGSVFGRLAPNFDSAHASDLQPDIAELWRAVWEDGFVPPEEVGVAEYERLRSAPSPSAMRGYVGFGGSFGGKAWGGYAKGGFQSNGSPRNHQGESARAIMRIARSVDPLRVTVNHGDYARWRPLAGDVVYCDPPYAETQGYATGAFDSRRFWSTMDLWHFAGAHVFVSEYAAPARWPELASWGHRQSLVTVAQGRPSRIERLFYREP